MTNFEKLYNEVIKKSLVEKFGYQNKHEIPKLTKIVLNMGVGDAVTDKKKLNNAADELALIAGLPQAPSVYSPYNNLDLAVKRRNQVLTRMYKMRYIKKDEYILLCNQIVDGYISKNCLWT